MRIMPVREWVGWAVALGLLVMPCVSAAQDVGPVAEPALQPPELIEYFEAPYPPGALAQELEAQVEAELELDERGAVVAVEITKSAGHGFDEAAALAMKQFKFAPAQRDGQAIPAIITYRYRFFLSKAVPVEAPPPADVEEGEPPQAPAVVGGDPEETDPLADVPDELHFESVVRGDRPTREVTRQTVTTEEITKIPGTSGDALRAVQNLPGMALADTMGGELMIRGSTHAESMFFFDSLNVPLLYHFGGFSSVINSDLIERIDYYPGNFSARYGRATGGVVDVRLRAPKQDRWHAYAEVDLWDVGLLAEGPLSENWSLTLSGRRSWIAEVLEGANAFGDLQLTVAPRYYDFQIIADYHPDKTDRLRLLFYGTDDRWEMTWDESGDPTWGSGLDLHIYTYRLQAEWDHRFTRCLTNQLTVGLGMWGATDVEGHKLYQDWDVVPLLIRDELSWDPKRFVVLRAGIDTEIRWGFVEMVVPGDIDMEGAGDLDSQYRREWFELDGTRFYFYPSAYAELELTAIPRTQILLGLRGDYASSIDRWGVDPRLAVRFELLPRTVLKGGIGLFHQVPAMQFVDEQYGNPELQLIRAVHGSAGLEQKLFDHIELSLEGFNKFVDNVLTRSSEMVERDGELVPERFANEGEGRSYGLEVQLRHNPTARFFGWLAYTLMRSERRDAPGGDWRLFDADQTHLLTAVASLNIGWGITAGLRFRLASGKPTTPIIGSAFDADEDEYDPIFGAVNTDRMPTFHQLDLRLEKIWQWDILALTVFADVQNVYNRKNPVGRIYNYDFTEQDHFYNLPIFPNLGLKLEH